MAFEDEIKQLKTTDTTLADNFNAQAKDLYDFAVKKAETAKAEAIQSVKDWSKGVFCLPNLLPNGSLQVWQNGTSFIGIQNGTYTADMFTTFAQGAVDVIKDGKWLKFTPHNASINAPEMFLEVPDRLLGKTVTLLFKAKASETLSSQIMIWNGKFSGSNSITSKPINITPEEQTFFLTFAVPSSVTNNLMDIWFTSMASLQEKSVWISECALIESDMPVNVAWKNYSEELALCQRYYQIRSTNNIADVDLRPNMRVTPTKTAVTGGYAYDARL